ncbi:MAG: rhodanese-like domain-containing protein, partial [Methyloceanibacter sp.]
IAEERAFNPRLQVTTVDEYVDLMSKLNLPDPKMMDVAVPTNVRVGLSQDEVAKRGWALKAPELASQLKKTDIALVDLREDRERNKSGEIPGSLHVSYNGLADALKPGGVLRELGSTKPLVFYCAFGERSAMAVQRARDAGLASARHLEGGFSAWQKAKDLGPAAK